MVFPTRVKPNETSGSPRLDCRGPNIRARDCPRRLFEAVEAVPLKVCQHFGLSGRPQDFHPVRLTAPTQSEMQPEVVLRQIAPSAPHFVGLRDTPGRDLYPRIQRHLIAS